MARKRGETRHTGAMVALHGRQAEIAHQLRPSPAPRVLAARREPTRWARLSARPSASLSTKAAPVSQPAPAAGP
eukprot:scaffold18861_cov26-Tisochrysis_lutea.AAC.4